MRNYEEEIRNRVQFIKERLAEAHANGIIFGNSGGKDSALVGILCRMATENVLGVIMPCQSKQNYGQDTDDAIAVAEKFDIKNITVDISKTKETIYSAISDVCDISSMAGNNINPRLRMTTLYTIAQSKNYLVAGTGNRSEIFMGYFTKWGDGGSDFNPIADLTATEVFEFLRYLEAPMSIIEKAPSAGLFDGQTDEMEMGISYAEIDKFILTGEGTDEAKQKLISTNQRTAHKRRMPFIYGMEW